MPGEGFDEDYTDKDYSPIVNKADEEIKSLSLDHLTKKKKDHVLEIVKEFPVSLYLPVAPVSPTPLAKTKNCRG